MYCNIVFMIDIFVISKITQYRYYVIAITDVRSLGLSTKWRTLMIKKTMKVRENTFRKLEDPFENGAAKKYVFYVKVDDVAEGIPMATNPRDQKLTSGVATAIKESLLSNDGYFHLKNRGIVLSAESVHYNNKEKIATIIFSDELSHGNIDGGHTYKIVCEHKGENLEQYVQFEVMTGVEDIIENLAEARNTSVQVDAKSMAELAEKFDPIKEGLEGMPFFKRIAFKQNQISVDDETGKKNKMIDAREIVAIISMFNISLYDALHHPTQAYSSKAKMLDMYLKNPEEYREYVNIMPDIFDLYDAVEMEFADAYNAGGGRYGRKKYAGYKDGKIVAKSKFGLNKMQYVKDLISVSSDICSLLKKGEQALSNLERVEKQQDIMKDIYMDSFKGKILENITRYQVVEKGIIDDNKLEPLVQAEDMKVIVSRFEDIQEIFQDEYSATRIADGIRTETQELLTIDGIESVYVVFIKIP